MKGSSINRGRNLKRYKVRGVFQVKKNREKSRKKQGVDIMIQVEKKAHNDKFGMAKEKQ